MKKTIGKIMVSACAAFSMTLITPVQAEGVEKTAMRRMYNPNSGEHFYTGDVNEARALIKAGWNYEGVGWYAPKAGNPVYRVYNPNAGDHHYTLDEGEKNALVSLGWKDEGIGWYSDVNEHTKLYREYNPNSGRHNYTTDNREHDMLVAAGWKDEGTAWSGVEYFSDDVPRELNGVYYTGSTGKYTCYVLGEQQKNTTEHIFGSTYSFDGEGYVIPSSHKGVQAALEAIRIANEGHGYSNDVRWGPTYDCSSYVITCFKNVGVDTGNAWSTANMVSELSKHGFEVIEGYHVDVPGDIYVTSSHASLFVGWNYDPDDQYAASTWIAEAMPEYGVTAGAWDVMIMGTGTTLRYRG